jgi:hypothetical protein
MPPTPYPDLNQVLQELLSSIQSILGDTFTGFSLQGSFALGDFDEHSDCDFIVVIKDELSSAQGQTPASGAPAHYKLQSRAQHLKALFVADTRDYTTQHATVVLDNGSRQLIQKPP